MNSDKFSHRRRGGMRFRPTGGIGNPKPAGAEAHHEAGEQTTTPERPLDTSRHEQESIPPAHLIADMPAMHETSAPRENAPVQKPTEMPAETQPPREPAHQEQHPERLQQQRQPQQQRQQRQQRGDRQQPQQQRSRQRGGRHENRHDGQREKQQHREQQQQQHRERETREQRELREHMERMEAQDAEEEAQTLEKKGFRQPRPDVPSEIEEEKYSPVLLEDPAPQGVIENIKHVATKVIKKVKNIINPKVSTQKEVIINAESLETRVAVVEAGRLEEFTIERTTEERLVGSIYKGKVRNLENPLKAAFIDIGFEKNAFLHYWDIIPSTFDSGVEIVERPNQRGKRDRPRVTQNDIPRLYSPGSDIIIQVTKGPIGTKGPRVTTNLVLPGRYLVLMPNSDQSGISRKIENQEERQRLKKILRNLDIPDGMGVIMRTAGEDQQEIFFTRDLALLLEQWNEIQEKIKTQSAPSCVFQEPDLIERTVRDVLTEDIERVVIDNQAAYDRMRAMIKKVAVRSFLSDDEGDKVKLYTEHVPIFDRFNISRQLGNAFKRQVFLKSGGYLIIDEAEALVAIDVNSGRHKGTAKDQESTILKVNLEAADEICRQLRLRNMGGLIVLDFIDMKSRRDQQAVYQKVKEYCRRDKAKTHVLPISQLGLMEMTRQRHSESVRSAVYDDCPYCKGRGKVKSAITMSVEIQRKLNEILKKRSRDESDFQLRIAVHPTVLERLRNEDEKIIIEMEKRYFGKLSFRPEPSFHAEQFKIVNVITEEELASVGS